jgi:hypothetical protein
MSSRDSLAAILGANAGATNQRAANEPPPHTDADAPAEDSPALHLVDDLNIERSEEAEPIEPRYRIYSAKDLDLLPEPAWLVADAIPEHGLVAVIGTKGCYKTFVVVDLACHVAAGLPWHGREARGGPVLYIYAEGPFGAKSRVDAWCAWQSYHSGVTITRADLALSFLPRRVPINDEAEVAYLLADIRRLPELPRLVVIDTLNANLDGDEDGRGMSGFAKGCSRIREALGATVIAVHHTPLGAEDRGRGHSSFDGEVDTRLIVSRDAERVTVECTHQRNGVDGWTVASEAVPCAGSLALKPSALNAGALKGQRRQLLELLHQEGTLSYSGWLSTSGLSASSFRKARSWLLANAYARKAGPKYECTEAGLLTLGALRAPEGHRG